MTTRDRNAAELARMPRAARAIVKRLGMQKIPHEGPWFAETHRSGETLEGRIAERYPGPRVACSAILALMSGESFSALHRLATDEFWHFHDGHPLALLLLHPDGTSEEVILGRDLAAGQHPQYRVPAGTWMGAMPTGGDNAWSLIGNTLAPGFDYADYEPGDGNTLCKRYAERTADIERLTRRTCDQSMTAGKSGVAMNDTSGSDADLSGNVGTNVTEPIDSAGPTQAFEELLGHGSTPPVPQLSIARFALKAGAATPASFNRTATEAIVILAGRGLIRIGDNTIDAEAGSVTALPPGIPHAIEAITGLVFLAITTPAFSLDEFVAAS